MALPLGTGQRFDSLKNKLAGQKGVRNPGALAASIGRKKYGKAGFAKLSLNGMIQHARQGGK
jgi:hypothetical protein